MKPRLRAVSLVAGAGLLLVTSRAAIAHHSFAAEFDANRPLNLTGAVTKLEWANPHTWFYIDVTAPGGKVVNWAFEMGSPNALKRAGWSRDTLKIGDVVNVIGTQARDGSMVGNARFVTLTATGQKLFTATSDPAARQQ